MRSFVMDGSVAFNRKIASGLYLMSLQLPSDFERPLPGQFVMVRLTDRNDILLARPFSVSGFHRDDQNVLIEILYRVTGRGTGLLAKLQAGQKLGISGALGGSFDVQPHIRNVILVSGGVGIAPLRYLMAHMKELDRDRFLRVDCFMGAKTADDLVDVEGTRCLCDNLQVCTDDCTMGHPGSVTNPLEKAIGSYNLNDTLICACGPVPMIKRLAELLTVHPLSCQVSLEERMACGLGACLGCAVALRGERGEKQYGRVCREGPVFDLQDILWE